MSVIQTNLRWAYAPSPFTKPVKYLVLHHAAGNGSVEVIHAYHRDSNGWAGIAYHLYVRKDGKVYAGRPMDRQGGHCLNYNGVSIGICFEGNFETETMSEAQKAGGIEAVAYAMGYYPGMTIVGHRELGSTDCPGKNFPLDYFKRYDEAGESKEKDPGVEVDYYGKVTASALNCREQPNADSPIVSSYPNGTVVQISREKLGWGYTGDGWVSLQYIQKVDTPETKKEEDMDISKLTNAQCYEIMQKAQQHAATLTVPDWAVDEYSEAGWQGITDCTRPQAFVTRCEAAIMALRAKKK